MSLDVLHAPLMPLLQQALAELPGPPPQRVLDLGCGAGLKLSLLEQRWPACRILGLDHTRSELAFAARAGYHGCLQADAQMLPLANNSLDMVWCCAVLGLLADPDTALLEIGRVLYPGGRALIIGATQRWVQPISWPPQLRHDLEQSVRPWHDQIGDPAAGPDAGSLARAGLQPVCVRAWPLDETPTAWGEIGIADWERVQPLAAHRLDSHRLKRCIDQARRAEPVVVSLLVATLVIKLEPPRAATATTRR